VYLLVTTVLLWGPPASAQQTFSSIKSPHFTARYQQRVEAEEVRALLSFLEAERTAILDQLQMKDARTLEVRIYGTVGTFMAETGQHKPWKAALFSRGVLHLQPLEALRARKLLEKAVVFELTAFLLEPVEVRGCPRWLREAYAAHRSAAGEVVTLPPGVRLQSFADLAQDVQDYQNPPQREDVEVVLVKTMQFLIDRYGKAAYGLFRAFDGVRDAETVISKTLGQPFSDVEKAWAGVIGTATPATRRR
jgi:hypothetical protein